MNDMIKKALAHLRKDSVMAKLIMEHPLSIEVKEHDLLERLTGAVVSQQLSTKAADTIYKRFLGVFGDKFPSASEIVDIDTELLRACGISYSKIKYIKGVAQAVLNKEIDLKKIPELSDEEVIAELVKLKGIGQWTAEMILMFSLYRPDVFSMGDLGLRNAIAKHYGVDRDDLKGISEIVKNWSPYRTFASRILWLSLDNAPKNT